MPGVLLVLGALAAVLLLTAFVLSHPKAIFWLAFVAPFVPIAYIDRYYLDLPAGVKWLPFVCVAFSALASLVLLPSIRAGVSRGIVLTYAALLSVSAFSMFVNDSSPAAFVVAQRGNVILIGAVVALRAAYRFYGKDDLFAFLVAAGLLSCLICFLQRLFVVPLTGGPDPGDRVTGLFQVGFITLFFHLVCIGIVIAYWLENRRVVPGPPLLILMVFVLGMAVGNQKAAIGYLLALVGFLLLRAARRATGVARRRLVTAMLVLPVAAVVVFAAIWDRTYASSPAESFAASMTDRSYLERYLFGDDDARFTPAGRLLRGSAIVFAIDLIDGDPRRLLFGLGPGATSESRVPGASGGLTRRFPGYAIDRLGLSMILAETGVLGLLVNVAFLLAIFAWKPAAGTEANEHRLIRHVFVFVSLTYLVYANLFYEPVYGLLAAIMIYPAVAAPRAARMPVRA